MCLRYVQLERDCGSEPFKCSCAFVLFHAMITPAFLNHTVCLCSHFFTPFALCLNCQVASELSVHKLMIHSFKKLYDPSASDTEALKLSVFPSAHHERHQAASHYKEAIHLTPTLL